MNDELILLKENVSAQLWDERFDGKLKESEYSCLHRAAAPSSAIISTLLEGLEPGPSREFVEHIFNDLNRLLGYLGWIGKDLGQGALLDETLAKFMLVRGEANFLVTFANTHRSPLAGMPEAASEALDGISYVIGHELRRVFDEILTGLHELRQFSLVRARLEHAHGILCNCFQQSVIVFARVLDPTLNGGRLFNDSQERWEQSLILYHDLGTLVQLIRRAERGGDVYVCDLLLKKLKEFRSGSMRYLMFGDWEFYERFLQQLTEARNTTDSFQLLHSLGCYLEMLHAQVRLRAVLAEYPADCIHAENEQ